VQLHVMQRTVLPKPFCPSALGKDVDCDKTKETYANILIPHERSFILVF